jgi:cation diffusion facilitator family transporter
MEGLGGATNAHAWRDRARAGRLSLLAGVGLLAIKLGAWRLTGSAAVLSDSLESVVNVVAAALLLYSLILSARPADRNHPYGHGKVEFFSAGVEGTLIALAAVLILIEAGDAILHGTQLQHLDEGLVLLTLAAGGNALLGAYLMRVGRRTHSLALVADGRHLMTDVATSVGVILGLGAVKITGWAVLDPLVAVVVAVNILRTGWKLMREAVGGLMDEADERLLERVVHCLEKQRAPGWIDVHSLRAWRSGPVQHTDFHLVVPRYFDADRLHRINDELTNVVLEAADLGGDLIVHFDPCRSRHCPTCSLSECPVRSAPYVEREAITLDRATREDELLDSGTPLSGESRR